VRNAASTTLVRGRHRSGRPGLVPVTSFVAVVRRGLFASWRRPGRHRRLPAGQPQWVPSPLPAAVPVAPVVTVVPGAASAAAAPGAYAL
jgi:hypothetical protein